METDRRDFLKVAGTAGAIAATGVVLAGTAQPASAAPAPSKTGPRGMAHGLTLLTFRHNGEYRLGVKTERGVLDVKDSAAALRMPAPPTMDDLLQNEDGVSLNALVDAAQKQGAKAVFRKDDAIEYGPVVTRPEKIVCVGLNYRRHAKETNQPVPKQPILFNKFNNTLNSHNGKIKLPGPDIAHKFDYETELVIVIGKEARNVSEDDAHKVIAGFATGNDFSARDLQLETGGQWMIGKTCDQFAPLGPYLVTADLVDADNLKIETKVNGETRQSSNTSDMVFSTRYIVSYVSRHMTLRGGDIIYTGTPEGVIQGMAPDKRVWLKAGDKVVSSLEKLGELKFDLV